MDKTTEFYGHFMDKTIKFYGQDSQILRKKLHYFTENLSNFISKTFTYRH